jgi:hypothetical protein
MRHHGGRRAEAEAAAEPDVERLDRDGAYSRRFDVRGSVAQHSD